MKKIILTLIAVMLVCCGCGSEKNRDWAGSYKGTNVVDDTTDSIMLDISENANDLIVEVVISETSGDSRNTVVNNKIVLPKESYIGKDTMNFSVAPTSVYTEGLQNVRLYFELRIKGNSMMIRYTSDETGLSDITYIKLDTIDE